MMMSVEQLVEWEFLRETDILGENLVQCHFLYSKSHSRPGIKTRATMVGSWRLTAWAMAHPQHECYWKFGGRCVLERPKCLITGSCSKSLLQTIWTTVPARRWAAAADVIIRMMRVASRSRIPGYSGARHRYACVERGQIPGRSRSPSRREDSPARGSGPPGRPAVTAVR
jgi:hypothetical protein